MKTKMIKSRMHLKNKKIQDNKTSKRHSSKASYLSQLRSWFSSFSTWRWWTSRWWKLATMFPKCL